MALRTLGTNATTSLSCLVFSGQMNAADFGNLKNLLKRSSGSVPLVDQGIMEQSGILRLIGERGLLTPQAGDVIAIDTATGWPILVSAATIAGGPWTLT